jgi:aminoglycoside phosphotransferase (APT) family kinase protein
MVRSAVERWIPSQIPDARDVTLSELTAATGGLSSETLFCEARWTEHGQQLERKLVLRLQPDQHLVVPDADVIRQYKLMKALGETTPLPIPAVPFAEPEGSVIGVPFFAMQEVEGTILLPGNPQPAHPNGNATAPVWSGGQLADIYDGALSVLATLHKVELTDAFDFLGRPKGTALDETISQAKHWYEWAKNGRDLGVIDVAMEWVLENLPEHPDCSICWGDARPGNLIVADDLSIAAVLDWEMAVLGPPEVDLGWWLMFEKVAFEGFRTIELPDGVPTREETISRYEELLGRSVRDIHFYEILAAFRLAVINVRLLELDAYGPISAGWILKQDEHRMIIGDPFTRLLAFWLDLEVPGAEDRPYR